MMDSKDLEAEIHPLKNEDKKLQENLGNQAKQEDNLKSSPGQPRLSRCRTVAFFLSLFLCLFVVFVVSFIIPCPDRPASQGAWSIHYNAAVTYDFLATEDINRDRIQDVLFLYKNSNSSNNFSLSCTDEGFSSPCTFVAAVSGANGSVLWERPAAQDGALVQYAVPQPQGSRTASACVLLGRPGSFVAVDLFTGETLWSHPSSFGRNASDPSSLLQLPDVDADGAPDLLVLTQEEKEVSGYIYSGSTGHQIGHRGSLGVGGTGGSLLHVTRMGAHYILFPCASSLCGHSVKGLHEEMTGRGSPLKRDPRWEGMLNATGHGVLWRSPGDIRYLMTVPGKAGEDLLLVSSEACVLLDGQDLAPRWTFSAAQVLRRPVLGYYKPDTLALVVENGTGFDRQILLLDLSTGATLWKQALPGVPGDPQSASLPTADHRSAFFFWGLHGLMGPNQTESEDAPHGLYMFHPTVPDVLLELASVSANIVAFRAVLFEPSRHAAYVLLTGPAHPDAPGVVSVAKYKQQGSRSLAEGAALLPGQLPSEHTGCAGPLPVLVGGTSPLQAEFLT
ncbi:protein FAM234A [Suricata suricatta]|uniref:protein FAM234A n=1 Tax=Suricata suricatta TaxID=37032 RepID=UPI00115581F4|nr:protein FAM234A [Suricata suricatta]